MRLVRATAAIWLPLVALLMFIVIAKGCSP